jgi:hypothetical protein
MKTSHVSRRQLDRDLAAPDRHRAVALPPDTIAEGVRRLGWIALVYAIAYVVGPFSRLVLTGVAGTIHSYEFVIPDVFGVAAVIMALTIFAMARRGVLSSRRLLDLGLVFQVGVRRASPSASSRMECR